MRTIVLLSNAKLNRQTIKVNIQLHLRKINTISTLGNIHNHGKDFQVEKLKNIATINITFEE